MLRTLSPRVPLARNATEKQLVNARPIYWLCVVQSVRYIGGSSPVAFARTDNSGRPILRRHPLTLIVFIHTRPIEGRGVATPFGAAVPRAQCARVNIDGLCVLARTI